MNNESDECEACGSVDAITQPFSEFSHLKPCRVKDIEGHERESMEPVFKNFRNLCFSCFNSATIQYVNTTMKKNIIAS